MGQRVQSANEVKLEVRQRKRVFSERKKGRKTERRTKRGEERRAVLLALEANDFEQKREKVLGMEDQRLENGKYDGWNPRVIERILQFLFMWKQMNPFPISFLQLT